MLLKNYIRNIEKLLCKYKIENLLNVAENTKKIKENQRIIGIMHKRYFFLVKEIGKSVLFVILNADEDSENNMCMTKGHHGEIFIIILGIVCFVKERFVSTCKL